MTCLAQRTVYDDMKTQTVLIFKSVKNGEAGSGGGFIQMGWKWGEPCWLSCAPQRCKLRPSSRTSGFVHLETRSFHRLPG